MNDEYIPVEGLEKGMCYIVDARNYSFAVWDGQKFWGLKTKFGFTSAQVEEHYDKGAPYGTVKPLKAVGWVDEMYELFSTATGK